MAKRLDDSDRSILEFRPVIDFVEPDNEPQAPNPLPREIEPLQLEDIEAERNQIKQLAKAVNALASATQARLDERAKDMVIKLDTAADVDAVQAMRRKFPGVDPTRITYQQYRTVRDDIRNAGVNIGAQSIITKEEVDTARENSDTAGRQLGGFGTEQARFGQLRPELDKRTIIIPPINIEKMQIDLICILVNFVWKVFIKPVFKAVAIPPPFGPSLADLLPDRLCDPGFDLEIPGLFVLGDKNIPDLLTGKAAQEAASAVGINF